MANSKQAPTTIKKEHLREHYVNQQGKDYIEYAGLIAEFHEVNDGWMREHPDERDLRGIYIEPVQMPSAENDQTAVVLATVTMSSGSVYREIGDANDKNTNRMVLPARIRMAATRAKGRALRDALNIGETMYEELPDGELPEGNDAPVANTEKKDEPKAKKSKPTDEQLTRIKALSEDLGRPVAISSSLSEETAASLIEQLEGDLTEQEELHGELYDKVTDLIPKYAAKHEVGQDEVVTELKSIAGIQGKIGTGSNDQLKDVLDYLHKGLRAKAS